MADGQWTGESPAKLAGGLATLGLLIVAVLIFFQHDLRGWPPANYRDLTSVVQPRLQGGCCRFGAHFLHSFRTHRVLRPHHARCGEGREIEGSEIGRLCRLLGREGDGGRNAGRGGLASWDRALPPHWTTCVTGRAVDLWSLNRRALLLMMDMPKNRHAASPMAADLAGFLRVRRHSRRHP